MKSTVCMRADTFTSRFALHPSLRLRADSLHFFAHVCVRSNVQIACPECTMPQAWLALVGRQAARNAALPEHRSPVPSGRGKVQGKIEGAGTLPAQKRVCTWGGAARAIWRHRAAMFAKALWALAKPRAWHALVGWPWLEYRYEQARQLGR